MLGLFGNKRSDDNKAIPQEWIQQTAQMQERWVVFLDKLEARMEELGTAAVAELSAMRQASAASFDQNLHQVHSGIAGQLAQMQSKAREVYEQQVYPHFNQLLNQLEDAGFNRDMAYDFREACIEKSNRFENKCSHWREELSQAVKEDNEAAYQAILEEYAAIKDKFTCQQCGAPIVLDKIYFTTTYLPCPACSTQNTYQPSSLAQSLPFVARSLAEERTAHLAQQYTIDANPDTYRHYLRAMFDEWNRIIPDMAASNEKFYQRLLSDFNHTIA